MSLLQIGPDQIMTIAKSLTTQLRVDLLTALMDGDSNLNELASRLNIPLSTATVNVQKLEEAGLINTEWLPGKRGTQKICSLAFEEIRISLTSKPAKQAFREVEMPLGSFIRSSVESPCGICTATEQLGTKDDLRTFLLPKKRDAQLVWFKTGFLEYHFPNLIEENETVEKLEISLEMCSEVPFYNNRAQSDIALVINGVDLGIWRSPGDFGGKKGKFTPDWWGKHKTQYGILTTWTVDANHTRCNGKIISDTGLNDLRLGESHIISLKAGVRDDAEKSGGINIFGKHFGNHQQDIKLRLYTAVR